MSGIADQVLSPAGRQNPLEREKWEKGSGRTADRLTRKEEMYVISQGRGEIWEGVSKMEDGRVVGVDSAMSGGAKSKKKNPWTSAGESEPEKVGTESATEEET